MIEYHDSEWGVPVHNDRKLFEFLVLDAFQAGVSWSIVLHKRANFRKAFHNFNAKRIAKYSAKDTKRLLHDAGIIRNRLKIAAAINNAQRFLEIQKEFGSFDKYIWSFVGGKPIVNRFKTIKQIPATSKESDAMSTDLKARAFKFVGSTICYAFMQAAGMVNDHTTDCFRFREVATQRKPTKKKERRLAIRNRTASARRPRERVSLSSSRLMSAGCSSRHLRGSRKYPNPIAKNR